MLRIHRPIFVFAGAVLQLASAVQAQDSVVLIGGAGSSGSNGSSDPATLDDGMTVATARYVFHLDVPNAQLVLTVENTSPVLTGVPNPVLTDVFFNAPAAITAMSIASQTGSGGATPAWTLAFDADLSSNPNPNGADGFGAFSAHLATPGGGVNNAFANPDADTLGIPSGTEVVTPVLFVFDLTGDLTGLTASSFSSLLSATPPGSNPQVAAGKFQSGGDAGSSGYVSPGDACPAVATSTDLGGGCGPATISCTPAVMGGTCTMTISGAPAGINVKVIASPVGGSFVWKGCTIYLVFSQLSQVGTVTTDAFGAGSVSITAPSLAESPACCGYEFVVQGMWIDQTAPAGSRIRFTNAVLGTLGS